MAATRPLPTRFAPAERASGEELDRQARVARGLDILREVLSTLPDLVLVLNRHRQVVFANRAVLERVGRAHDDLRGLRPGELLGCAHARETPGGCGTTESCSVCGMVRAILSPSDEAEEEARLNLETGEALDLRVRTQRISAGGEELTVLALKDIADEKRRRVLERVFFHDVLNTAGGVRGLADLVGDVDEEQRAAILQMLRDAADQLLAEIQAQRLLSAAESGEYVVTVSRQPVGRVLEEAVATYTPLARMKLVRMEPDRRWAEEPLETDHTVLGRVLGNLVKNAIEASREGDSVRLGAECADGVVCFTVNNPAVMPASTELQIFQRSFSTKGAGRGLGTWSVKLFTERYLRGRVGFTSSVGAGTTFRVELPRDG